MKATFLVVLLIFSHSLIPGLAFAQWQLNGVPVSAAPGDQVNPVIIPDGAGGALVAWEDRRSGIYSDIYMQRVDASGVVQWSTNGNVVTAALNTQERPAMISDGAAGAIVTWHDYRNGSSADIYAQRVDASGVPLWAGNGVVLCAAADDQVGPAIVSDGSGGAIVTWEDYRSGSGDIYAQRVDASGVPQWAVNGVSLCTATSDQGGPVIVSDGAGGAIAAWIDGRSGNFDIYAQRVNASGVAQWAADGVPLCSAADAQFFPAILADGAGGAIVTWDDARNGADYDVYAQRVDGSGMVQWTTDGVALCTATDYQFKPTVVSDGTGGAVVTWEDYRSASETDVYAQRVDASGAVQWTTDGVAICTATDDQLSPTIASDGAGGAIVTWRDNRDFSSDIYAQRVDASGAVQWTADGVALCTAVYNQFAPVIASEDGSRAVVAWYDLRNGTDQDIYALEVGPDGSSTTGVRGTPSASEVALSPNFPNPFSAGTTVDMTLTRDRAVTVDVFDAAGRRVREINVGTVKAGATRLSFDGLDDHAHPLPSGVYFYRVHAGRETVTQKMVITR